MVARKFQGLANFLQTEDESLIEKFSSNIDRPVVVLLSEGLQNEIYNENPFDRESLEDWVAQRRFPLVSEIDVSTFEELASSGSPTVVGVVEQMSEKDFSAYLNMLREIALQFRGRYTFGYLYASHWTQWLARMEVPENSYPTVLVMNILQERHYLPDSRFHFVRDHSGIVQFLEDVSQGKVAAKGPSFWSPSRIMRRVDDWLTDNFTDTQIIIGISSILGIFTLLILWGMCSAVGVEAETSPVKVSSPSTEPISSQPIQKKKRKAE